MFEALTEADLTQAAGKTLLAQLKTDLDKHLLGLDEVSTVGIQGRKSYLTQAAGLGALEQQAKLDVRDYLLSPAEQRMVEDCSRGPTFRPGMYSLHFSYQDKTVEFAGAFVLTRKSSPVVDNLTSVENLGQVLLFTPNRGWRPSTLWCSSTRASRRLWRYRRGERSSADTCLYVIKRWMSSISGPCNCCPLTASHCSNTPTTR